MKKFLPALIISCFALHNLFCVTCAAASQNEIIGKIENSIYGFEYTNDNSKNRLERIEKTVYGKPLAGDVNKRIEKLSQDIAADVIGLEIPPCEDTFLEEEKEEDVVADSSAQYPIVDEIEQKLFNQTYKNRDFHTRIVTIERKLFGKIYDVDDYSTRMDRIKEEVMPERFAKNSFPDDKTYYDDTVINSKNLAGNTFSRFSMPFGQKNYTRPYANYGDEFTGGSAPIQSQGLNEELAQLEYETFGTEFSNEDTASRIKRLNSVHKAQQSSSKYDSNKFNQRMSTVMEIGAMILMILAMVL